MGLKIGKNHGDFKYEFQEMPEGAWLKKWKLIGQRKKEENGEDHMCRERVRDAERKAKRAFEK